MTSREARRRGRGNAIMRSLQNSAERHALPLLELEWFGLLHLWQRAHPGEHVRWQLPVDLDQRHRIPARYVPADVEGGNIDAGVAHRRRELADEAWFVEIGDVDHRLSEFGVHTDALDIDDARAPIGEDGARHMAGLPVG